MEQHAASRQRLHLSSPTAELCSGPWNNFRVECLGTDLPSESPNRKAFRYLGIAVATSVVLPFPMEHATHANYMGDSVHVAVKGMSSLWVVLSTRSSPLFSSFSYQGQDLLSKGRLIRNLYLRPSNRPYSFRRPCCAQRGFLLLGGMGFENAMRTFTDSLWTF